MSVETQGPSINPVFVLGIARNGTTWLGNLLAGHNGITAAAHFLHHGIHESNILQNKYYWGDLEDVDAYISFIHQYSSEDYFLLCQGNREHFLAHRQHDFYRFFLELMDQYAVRQAQKLWTTKLDPLFYIDKKELNRFLKLIDERYGQPKFIAIKRNLTDYLKSYINMEGAANQLRKKKSVRLFVLLLGVMRYVNSYRKIKWVVESRKGLFITYEDLLKQKEGTLTRIADYLGIPGEAFEEIAYKPNTSFQKARKSELNNMQLRLAKLLFFIFNVCPWAASGFLKLYQRAKSKPAPLFHRLLKYRYYPEELKLELEKKGSYQLLDRLNNTQ